MSVPLIPISQLVLDEKNPRFAEPMSQDEMIAEFAKQPKTAGLAKHIAAKGLDPLAILAVSPVAGRQSRFVVREGNRRLSALKLLHNPSLAGSVALTNKFQSIANGAEVSIPRDAPCAVFTDKRVDEWMAIKHGGVGNGEGTAEWGAQEKGRFDDRTGRSTPHSPALSILDHAVRKNWITPEEVKKVTMSNLTRLLSDSDVQASWGLKELGSAGTAALDEATLKRLSQRLVKDWTKGGNERVATIYSKTDRKKYAARVSKEETVKPGPKTTVLSAPPEEAKPKRPKVPTHSTDRKTLIPRDTVLAVPKGRLGDIYLELRKLNVEDFPNAVSVLFRTFLELSVEHHLNANKISYRDEDKLRQKVSSSCDHIVAADPKKRDLVAPLSKAVSTDGLYTIKTFNQYVHNKHAYPLPKELKLQWNSFEAYFSLVWS